MDLAPIFMLASLAFLYYYRKYHDRYLLYWSVSWAALLLILLPEQLRLAGIPGYNAAITVTFLTQIPALLSGFFLVWGMSLFLKEKPPKIWLFSLAGAGVLECLLIQFPGLLFLRNLIAVAFLSLANIEAGLALLHSRTIRGLTSSLTALGLIVLALARCGAAIVLGSTLTVFACLDYPGASLLEPAVALGLVLLYSQYKKTSLLYTEKQFRQLVEFLPDATFAIDLQGKVIAWNRAIEEMTGVPKKDILGRGEYCYAVPFYGKPTPMLIEEIIAGVNAPGQPEQQPGETRETLYTVSFAPCLGKGEGAFIWIVASPLFSGDGKLAGAIGSIRDITARKQMEQKLQYLSTHDSLTGLYNRAYLEQELERLAAAGHSIGMVVADVDGLKLINDTMGHQRGDELLIAASRVIKSSFQEDDIVARIGGDEFAILLPDATADSLAATRDRVMENMARYNAEDPDLPLSLSIGCAFSKEQTPSYLELFREADNNMYSEKLRQGSISRSAIMQVVIKSLKARDFGGHTERLKALVDGFSATIGVSQRCREELCLLAQFHDIGKMGAPEQLLFKDGFLTPDERTEMQRHPEIGHRIASSTPDLAPIAHLILKHHEWWDGSGYPLRLKGEDIPLECRILAIASAYEAMTSSRPYRRALTHDEAIAELQRCAGTQFDPNLVPAFIAWVNSRESGTC